MVEQTPTSDPGRRVREKIAEYSVELKRLKEMLDLAFGRGAKSSKAPEDRVVFPLLVSCRDILEEILYAAKDGFGRVALRNARTMYECVVIARYLNLHPDKTDRFLSMFHVQWAKIIQNVPAQFRPPAMHSTLAACVPKYGQQKPVSMKDLNWSGKHTLQMAKEAGALAALHSVAFDYTSAFVHPSAVFVLRTMSKRSPVEDAIEIGIVAQDDEARLALLIGHDLVMNAVDLRLRYAPSQALKDRFEACKQDFENIWDFTPHL